MRNEEIQLIFSPIDEVMRSDLLEGIHWFEEI